MKNLDAAQAPTGIPSQFRTDFETCLRFLESADAIRAIETDVYWPKWGAPWWQMLLLHEMGEAHRIPGGLLRACVVALNNLPLKEFPFDPERIPVGVDPCRGYPCHCQLGNIYQVLFAAGVDVDRELPWIRPWFLHYQMADGGLNCDGTAYLVNEEVPSSMVATIAAFEAILICTKGAWTPEEKSFLDRAADFLVKRRLVLGSPTTHNADERESAKEWGQLCFPRFYFYDVLRGLTALTLWAEKSGQKLSTAATREAVAILRAKAGDGELRCERVATHGQTTVRQSASGEWLKKQPATTFPLLEITKTVGTVSPYLSGEWVLTRTRLEIV